MRLRKAYPYLLLTIGMLVALYGIKIHYEGAGSICNIGETFDCDKVNQSQWAEIFGIPVAVIGLVSYVIFLLILIKRSWIKKVLDFADEDVWQYLTFFAGVILAFQIYLTLMEVFFIRAYCLICLTNQIIVILLFIFALREWRMSISSKI